MRDRISRILASDPGVMLGVAIAVFTIVVMLRTAGALEPLELLIYDGFRRSLPLSSEPIDPRVTMIEYTEDDIQTHKMFPLPDRVLAQVLATVLENEPRSIGVDFYRDVPIEPGSADLEALLASDPRTIMISRYGDEDLLSVPPPPVLEGTDQVGFSDLVLDDDDTVRRAILYQDDETFGTGLSLALRTSMLYLAAEGIMLGADPDDPELLRLGPTTIPRFRTNDGGYSRADDGGYQMLIDYRGGHHSFQSYSISDILAGDFDPAHFRDHIVFVGVSAETHVDVIRVPFGQWPGVFVHGHIASQLLRYGLAESEPPSAIGDRMEIAWMLLWGVLGALVGLPRTRAWIFGLLAIGGAAGLVTITYLALSSGLWLTVAGPGLAWLASGVGVMAILSRREHGQLLALMQLFSRHVSENLAQSLWEQRDEFLDGGRPRPQRLTATILFADVKGSTSLGEKLDPLQFMEWLNDFMDAMASQAEEHGGFVDDYFGDGLKADFGIPVPRRTEEEMDADAVAAVRCALSMGAALSHLNQRWREKAMPEGAMRVGITTGLVVAGSLGAADRLKYTLVGDLVNTAARLENLDDSQHDFEARPCRILVSEDTLRRLGGQFATQNLGEFSLKGKEVRIAVSEILGAAGVPRDKEPTP
jgi:adenylate cyclase